MGYNNRNKRRTAWFRLALAGLVVSAAAVATVGSARTLAQAAASQHPYTRVCSAPAEPGRMTCLAYRRTDIKPLLAGASPSGYGPATLRSAYNLTATGSATQTVAIVDAYDDPNAESDLAVYRNQYSLPACTTANGCFTKVNQNGGTGYPSADPGWAGEISLDLDMVSAICPGCHILLVEASSNSMADLGTAVDEAVALGAKYISNSYGAKEDSTVSSAEAYFNHPGVVITAASGDGAFADGTQYPASSQYVTAVGGTSLSPATNARGWTESAWYTSTTPVSGAGSGCSAYIAKPSWQTDPGCSHRMVADVAAVADPATGVSVYQTYGGPGWAVYGGTSVGSPIIASVYALAAVPGSADDPAKYPYQHTSNLFDVTSGSTGSCSPAYFCTAQAGYDGPTGLGTPNGTAAFAPALPGSVALTASAGAADTSGRTVVTLDASGTTGAGTGASYSFDFGDRQAALVSATPVVTRPEWEGTYKVTVTVTDSLGRTGTSTPQWLTVGDGYHAVSPTRLLDTRYGVGAPAAAVGSMQTLTLQLPASVTANASGPLRAVVLNVTVTNPASYGDIRVYPDGLAQRPATSSLNFTAGLTVANLVTVPVLDGKVTLFVESPGSADLIADLFGYYTAGTSGAGFAPLSPTRILDTRNGTGGVGGRVASGGTVSLPVPASVPADATAVVMNATAVNTSSYGNLRVYPDVPGQAPPTASNLNFTANGTVPNLVIVPVSADRKIDFHVDSPGAADLIADIEGYFSPSATSKFVPWYPTRLFDTRNGDAGGAVPSGYAIQVSMAYGFNVPVSALTAGLYNVTVTQPAGHGYITVFPDGLASVPVVSNLNYVEGQTVPNAVLAPMTDGKEIFYNGGTAATHLIADFFGYFAKPLATDAPPTSAVRTAVRTQY